MHESAEYPMPFSFRTADPAVARAVCHRFYYPIDLDPIGRADAFSFSCAISRLGPITVGEIYFGADVRIRAADLETAYHVNTPLTGRVHSRHRGVPVLASRTAGTVCLPSGSTTLLPWMAGCRQICVKFDRGALEQELEVMLGHPVRTPIRFRHHLDLTSDPGRDFVRLLHLLNRELQRPAALVRRPLMAEPLRRCLMTGLLLATEHQYSENLTNGAPPRRPRPVKRAIDAMVADPGRVFTVADLAEIAGVRPRTLQAGFHHHVGVPPMAYLRRLRLEGVHAELCEPSSADATVSSIAYRWGFLHLGRFASDYRQRYGRPPSETLRRHR